MFNGIPSKAWHGPGSLLSDLTNTAKEERRVSPSVNACQCLYTVVRQWAAM